MKTLILARHSIAENDSETGLDHDRKLSDNGKYVAKNQIIKLLSHSIQPEILFSSDAKRAIETATIFSHEIKLVKQIQIENFLYSDYSTSDFLKFIATIPESVSSAMIVAHNPSIANMAFRLSPEFNHSVQPGTIMVFSFKNKSWNQIEVGTGKLERVLIP
ncbi:MAG: histidine phosphatase family protein [Bacteroidales bacterium]|nr:histidine phosphatase family protein [Bacteroidales bacterium]